MKPLLVLLLMVFSAAAFGQDISRAPAPFRDVLKVNPLPLFDPYAPGLAVAWQHRLSSANQLFLENSLAVLFPNGLSEPNVTGDLRGMRLRTSLQKYLKPFSPGLSCQYLGLMTHLQWSSRTVTADFWRQDFSFQQQLRYRHEQTVVALYFTLGATNWWRNERLVTDFGFAAGPRWVINDPQNLPADAEFITNGTLLFLDHTPSLDRLTFGIVLLFKIGWVFGK